MSVKEGECESTTEEGATNAICSDVECLDAVIRFCERNGVVNPVGIEGEEKTSLTLIEVEIESVVCGDHQEVL